MLSLPTGLWITLRTFEFQNEFAHFKTKFRTFSEKIFKILLILLCLMPDDFFSRDDSFVLMGLIVYRWVWYIPACQMHDCMVIMYYSILSIGVLLNFLQSYCLYEFLWIKSVFFNCILQHITCPVTSVMKGGKYCQMSWNNLCSTRKIQMHISNNQCW
jgi:hypothetical protein